MSARETGGADDLPPPETLTAVQYAGESREGGRERERSEKGEREREKGEQFFSLELFCFIGS